MGYYWRFSLYLLCVLASIFFVWFGLKNYGLSAPIPSYETELVKKLKKQAGPISWSLSSLDPQAPFQWEDLFFLENRWVLGETKTKGLKEFLEHSSAQWIILMLQFDSPKALPALRETMKKSEAWKKIIFCSRSDGLLQDLRELEPQWSFCSGEILMTRLLGLSSIGLGSLISIKPDVFFIHLKNISLSKSIKPAIDEAIRQNKMVFIGPVTGPSEGYSAHGWMVKK